MTEPVRLTVYGVAQPQGSKTAVVRNGRAVVIEGRRGPARATFVEWRSAIANAGREWRAEHGGELLDEPVAVALTFWLPKPASTPKWRLWAKARPDLDKLTRAALDALTGVVLSDDARVVSITAHKPYAVGTAPRAEIVVTPLGDDERAGRYGVHVLDATETRERGSEWRT